MHFWTDSAEAQFIQTKAQFALKFYFCDSSFNQETANQVLDTVKSSHSDEPCEALKRLCWSCLQGYFQPALVWQHKVFLAQVKYVSPPPHWSKTVFFPLWSFNSVSHLPDLWSCLVFVLFQSKIVVSQSQRLYMELLSPYLENS